MEPDKQSLSRLRSTLQRPQILAVLLGVPIGLLAGNVLFRAVSDEGTGDAGKESGPDPARSKGSVEAAKQKALEHRRLGLSALRNERYEEAVEHFALARESPYAPAGIAELLELAKSLGMMRRTETGAAAGRKTGDPTETRRASSSAERQARPETSARGRTESRNPSAKRSHGASKRRTRAGRKRPDTDRAEAEPGVILIPKMPPGLSVRVDGEVRARSTSRLKVAPGRHEVTIVRGDRILLRRQIEVLAGRYVSIDGDVRNVTTSPRRARSRGAFEDGPNLGGPAPPSSDAHGTPGGLARPPFSSDVNAPSSSKPSSPSVQTPTRAKIEVALKRVMPRVRQCYERELASNPWLSGEVVARIKAAPSGAVEKVTIERSTLDSKATIGCIVRLLRRLEFPASSSGQPMRFSVPLAFEPEAP